MFVLRLMLGLILLLGLLLGAMGLSCTRPTKLGFSQWGVDDAGPDAGDSTDDSESETDTNNPDGGSSSDSGPDSINVDLSDVWKSFDLE